jgi:hypothetical protein
MAVKNECYDVVVNELDALGIDYFLEDRGKHQAVCWSYSGKDGFQTRTFIIPVSPSDWRAPLNTKTDIRKILRSDGLINDKGEPVFDAAAAARLQAKNTRLISKLLSTVEEDRKRSAEVISKLSTDLQKSQSDIEGLLSLIGEATPAPPVPTVTSVPTVFNGTPAELFERIIAEPDSEIAIEKGVPIPPMLDREVRIAEIDEWQKLELKVARNLRLPQRPGYRIVPEHYRKLKPHEMDAVASTTSTSESKKRGKYNITPEGLERLRENAARARAKRAEIMAQRRNEND